MSHLVYDGTAHQVTLVRDDGTVVGSWTAYNNVDSHASLRSLGNATYQMLDTVAPLAHPADPDGPYGSYGIFRFSVPGHVGIGLHSGRENARHQPGPQHATMGCIRTTDEAMHTIADNAATEALTTMQVMNNSASNAHLGVARHGRARTNAHGRVAHAR